MNVKFIPLDVISCLMEGGRVRSSDCKQAVFAEATRRKVLLRVRGDAGRGFCLYAPDVFQFRSFILEYYRVRSIEALRRLDAKVGAGELSRADQVGLTTSGTKTVRRKVTSFVPVNVFSPLEVEYEGRMTVLYPTYDLPQHLIFPEKLKMDSGVVIVGTENYETIARISDYRDVFSEFADSPVLFVQRPLGKRNWLRQMLSVNSCRYVHFGDLDWGGISLYLAEYKSFLGDRAQFFVPDDVELYFDRLGLASLYDSQEAVDFSRLVEPGLERVAWLIRKYRKGVEEEAFGLPCDWMLE